jgi:hypothetical protein
MRALIFDVCHLGGFLSAPYKHHVFPHKPPDIATLDAASGEGDFAKKNCS